MDKMQENTSVGIDIGTHKIAIAVSQVREGLVNITGLTSVPSAGLRRGSIVDPEEVVSSLSAAIEDAQRISGTEITNAILGYGGIGIATTISRGVVSISRPDGEINEEDIERVIEAAKSVALPPNQEIIHLYPAQYTIDSQEQTKDPRGMRGIRLETEALTIGAPSANIRNLTHAVDQAGVSIDAIIFNPIAAARAILTKKQKEIGVALIDIGAATTSIVVYEEGDVLHTAVLPVGAGHITSDIAIGLRCSIETAEKVKLQFGHSDPKAIEKHEEIDLSKIDASEEETTMRHYVVEIIEARLEEIFDLVNAELKKINRDGKLPSGVVLSGGGSRLPGVVEFAKKRLRLPVTLGRPQTVHTVIDRVDDPTFATATGLVLWGGKFGGSGSAGSLRGAMKNVLNSRNFDKVKKWFKSFLP